MFVTHIFATQPALPAIPPGLYQYVVGDNGVFVRASRPGLEAMVPVLTLFERVRGLAEVQPYVKLTCPVPRYMTEHLFLHAWRERRRGEVLYYLKANPWYLWKPEQVQSPGGVHPVNPYAAGADTLLEVHSHHSMAAFFSHTDNRDERAGFRLFAVLGKLDQRRPEMRVRVGIYGHFWEIPAEWVFDLPSFAVDAAYPKEDREVVYEDIAE